jgi:hypothetical protein
MARYTLRLLLGGASVIALALSASPALAVKLFNENDLIRAIDLDPNSSLPGNGNEGPDKVVDQVFTPGPPVGGTTKYLNFGKEQTGFITTPMFGSSIVQSFQLRAANDAAARDPLTYELYGTNDPITSTNNSFGDQENWSLISSGDTGLATDPGRHLTGTIEDIVGNTTAYSSYKMIFPTIRDTAMANSMQVADVQFFTDLAGGGSTVVAAGDPSLAVTHNMVDSLSSYPGGENPTLALDGNGGNKYLNFARENSGLIVSRADGAPTIVESLTFTTAPHANEENRDPLTWELYGTNDAVQSADNSRGNLENWILVDTGDTGFETDPGRGMPDDLQMVENSTAYNAYRLVFPTLRGGEGELMQIGDILIEGQAIPEPSTIALVGLALLGGVAVTRRS